MADFDFSQALGEARTKYESIAKALNVERLEARIKDLEAQASQPNLWDDVEHAQQVTSNLSAAQSQVKKLQALQSRLDDVEVLFELGQEEQDAGTIADARTEVGAIQTDLDAMEIETLMDGEYDERAAVVTIRSGAGGVDAADFAEMLMRMYLRWAERNGYKAKVMDTSYAEEAGIKSATFQVNAPYAYGRLSVEEAPIVSCGSRPSTTRVAGRRASRPSRSCPWSRRPITSTSPTPISASTPTARRVPEARA